MGARIWNGGDNAQDIMSDHFTLDSGRVVSIETISIRNTYESLLEGNPLHIREIIWQRTVDHLRRDFGEDVLILKPSEPKLPDYRFVAVMHSDPLPAPYPRDYSYVKLCWFQDGVNGNLVEFVWQAAKGLDWEKHAKNWLI